MNIKKIFILFFVGLMSSGSLNFILGNSILLLKNKNHFILRDLKLNTKFVQFLSKEDHDGSLINKNAEFPKLDVNTNNIGASDTSSNLELLGNSKCNILLMGSSTIQASALPKNNRIESQVRKSSSCNVVNIGSVGESLEGSLLKYLTIKELEQFQFVYLMLGGIDAYLADNPNERKFYEPLLGNIILERFERKFSQNNFLSKIFNQKKDKISHIDSLEVKFQKDLKRYKNILKTFKYAIDSREAKLYLITTPYEPRYWVNEKDGPKINTIGSLNLFNEATRSISKKYNLELIDLETIFNKSKKNYLYDSEHFNNAGAKVLAEIIIKNIQELSS